MSHRSGKSKKRAEGLSVEESQSWELQEQVTREVTNYNSNGAPGSEYEWRTQEGPYEMGIPVHIIPNWTANAFG